MHERAAWVGAIGTVVLFAVVLAGLEAWLNPLLQPGLENRARALATSQLTTAELLLDRFESSRRRIMELAVARAAEADEPERALAALRGWRAADWKLAERNEGEAGVTGPWIEGERVWFAASLPDTERRLVGGFPVKEVALAARAWPAGVRIQWMHEDRMLFELDRTAGFSGPMATHAIEAENGLAGTRWVVTAVAAVPALLGPLRSAVWAVGAAVVALWAFAILASSRGRGASALERLEAKAEAAYRQSASPSEPAYRQSASPSEPAYRQSASPSEPAGLGVGQKAPGRPASVGSSMPAESGQAWDRSVPAAAGSLGPTAEPAATPGWSPVALREVDEQVSSDLGPFQRSEASRFDAVSYHDIQLDQGVPRRADGPLTVDSNPDVEERTQVTSGRSDSEDVPKTEPGPTEERPTEDLDPGADPPPAGADDRPPSGPFSGAAQPETEGPQTVPAPPLSASPAGGAGGPTGPEGLPDADTADLPPFDEAHYRRVYNDFVAAKARVGEAVGNLSYDGFRRKLQASEEGLIGKHGCRTVRFMVVTRGDKVTLRPQLVR